MTDSGQAKLTAEVANRKAFGQRLRASIPAGMKLADFASAMNVGLSTLQNWMAGKSDVGRENLERILEITGVAALWLLTGAGPMRPSEPAQASDEAGLKVPSTAVDEDLYGRVTEAVSMAYRECGYTATLRQIAARAARIAASIAAAGGTPDQQAFALRVSIDQLRTELRQAVADPAGAVSGKSRV